MRLIDADKLIIYLNDWALREAPLYGSEPYSPRYEAIRECIETVEEYPTAYDPDREKEQIIKVLEKQRDSEYFNVEWDAVNRAIEKVKEAEGND